MINFDEAYKDFNEMCALKKSCKECYNRYNWEDQDAAQCFREYLKENQTRLEA